MTQDAPPSSQTGAPTAAEREASLKSAKQHDAEIREAQYTRKLTLAILSTLQHKGILSAAEVDQLLVAAKRATDAAVTPTAAVRSEFVAPEPQGDPKHVRREPKPPPIFDIQID